MKEHELRGLIGRVKTGGLSDAHSFVEWPWWG